MSSSEVVKFHQESFFTEIAAHEGGNFRKSSFLVPRAGLEPARA